MTDSWAPHPLVLGSYDCLVVILVEGVRLVHPETIP